MLEIDSDDATSPSKHQTTGLWLRTACLKAMTFLTDFWGKGKQKNEKTWEFGKSTLAYDNQSHPPRGRQPWNTRDLKRKEAYAF